MKILSIITLTILLIISCMSLPAKRLMIDNGTYFTQSKVKIVLSNIYFVDVNNNKMEIEFYSLYKGFVIKRTNKVIYLNNYKVYDKKNFFKIINDDESVFIDGLKLQQNNVIYHNECAEFCNFHKEFLNLSITDKRMVCRNAEYRYRKSKELEEKFGINNYNILKEINILLPHLEYKKKIDNVFSNLVKNNK